MESISAKISAGKKCLRSKAFTLIELLVVISIIAVLMSIMMPTLSKARESAKSTICRSQLKQFGIALATYAQDNNNAYLVHDWSAPAPTYGYWFGRISPYIEVNHKTHHTSKLMRCPSGQAVRDYGDELVYSWTATDYGLQAWPGYDSNGNPREGKFDNIKQPARFAAFFDFYYGDESTGIINDTAGVIWGTKWYTVVRDSRDADMYRDKIYRHNSKKGINAVYVDGHVDNAKNPDWWNDLASPSSMGWSKRK